MERLDTAIRDRRAISAIEFAILAPVLLLLLVGLVDLGTVVLAYLKVERAVAAAVQVSPRTSDAAELTTIIKTVSQDGDSVSVSVTEFCTCDDLDMGSCAAGCGGTKKRFLTLTASTSVSMVVDYGLFDDPMTLSSTASVRVP